MHKLLYLFISILFLSTASFALEAKGVVVKTLAKSSSSWNGASLPAYPKGQPQVTILDITIPPHSKLPMHKHPIVNAGILVSGELTVVSEKGKVLELKAGDSIVELVDTWHYGENKGDVPAQIIVFYAGIKNEPITVLKK
ncbi:MAG: cupin domain-containing protein [Candidatus Marinarcus sp.]|uniref:cupin domain-containing protein n=1 Tax=Candidatus Marinarcus sp. TaxID=3100987 RepID=UPI003B00510D